MRAFRAICGLFRTALCASLLAILVHAEASRAQPIPFGIGLNTVAPAELTAPHVDIVSGPAAARLEQARALVAARNWDDAIDIYRELADDTSGSVIKVDENRYVGLRFYCQLQLAKLPVEGLAAY